MLIRPARIEDVRDFAMLESLSFEHEAWSLEQIHGSMALQTTYGWEIVEDGRIAAYVLVQRALDESEILTLAVHPDYRRRGFAARLVEKVIETTGAGTVFLEVAADNEAAIKLYEKCGFKLFATRPAYYKRGSRAVDALAYRFVASA